MELRNDALMEPVIWSFAYRCNTYCSEKGGIVIFVLVSGYVLAVLRRQFFSRITTGFLFFVFYCLFCIIYLSILFYESTKQMDIAISLAHKCEFRFTCVCIGRPLITNKFHKDNQNASYDMICIHCISFINYNDLHVTRNRYHRKYIRSLFTII